MEGQVDLVLLLVAFFGDRHFRLVESIFFQHSLDAGQSAVEFLPRVEFAELQAGGACQLVRGGIGGNAFNASACPRKNWRARQKAQADAGGFGAIRFGLNIGEPSGGKKSLHRVVQCFARERFADLERRGREQRSGLFRRNARQLDSDRSVKPR